MTNKSIPTVRDVLTSYVSKNQTKLEKFYPGFSLLNLLKCNFVNPTDLYLGTIRNKLDAILLQLDEGIPFAYISNRSFFFNDSFYVENCVLIPRSETELLVEMVLDVIKKKEIKSVWDIGTGSDIIAISIRNNSFKELDIVASDISEKALQVAKYNAFLTDYKQASKQPILFIHSDLGDKITQKFDMIVSNPPYIMQVSDQSSVHKSVKKFEPAIALYLPDSEYFNWFSKLFKQVIDRLNPEGIFFMEGHEDHLRKLVPIASDCGFSRIEIKQDYTQRDRFLILEK